MIDDALLEQVIGGFKAIIETANNDPSEEMSGVVTRVERNPNPESRESFPLMFTTVDGFAFFSVDIGESEIGFRSACGAYYFTVDTTRFFGKPN